MESVIMLPSGDNEKQVAREAGISTAIAQVRPEAKLFGFLTLNSSVVPRETI